MLGFAVTINMPEPSANGNVLLRCSCICRFFSRPALDTDPLRRTLWSDATCAWRWTFLLVEEVAFNGRFSR